MPIIDVTRTYLEMTAASDLRPVATPPGALFLERADECPASLFRYLYTEVGGAHRWTDRLGWTDDAIRAHLATAGITLWILRLGPVPVGYFELRAEGDAVEIAYLGLLPEFIGRGWGKYLLARAVETAWSSEPGRVWLHTCTLDHPSALPNYVARGFRPVREERYEVTLP